jgi:hypothetical protein
MAKKTERQKLVKRLDVAVSLYIRGRDGRCVLCQKTYQLTNGHIFTRKNYSTRWDIAPDGNCHCQCRDCNFYHSHDDKYKYYRWYVGKFSQIQMDELYRRHHTVVKFKNFELEEKLMEVNKSLEEG